MKKFKFVHWRTFPIKKESFKGQYNRFALTCVVSVDSPEKVIDVIPIFGKNNDRNERIIKLIYNKERNIHLDEESEKLWDFLQRPVYGKFVEEKSMHGPLFRIYTQSEADHDLCPVSMVGKPERDENGKIKEYATMKIFTWMIYDSGKWRPIYGWFPQQRYYLYFGHRYHPISQLKKDESRFSEDEDWDECNCDVRDYELSEEDIWDALTDGMYGNMPTDPTEYDARMDSLGF